MFLCIFLNTGFPDRPSSSTESIFLMQKCALLIARPWLQQLFWLVYFDSRSWLIFFWFVFGPHLWKCSPSSADSVLCWREVEKRSDDKPEVALTFIDRKYENSVEYGRTSGGKLVLLVITAKLIVSCTFRRVLWNSFSWCGLVLFHRNHVFRSFRTTRGWQVFWSQLKFRLDSELRDLSGMTSFYLSVLKKTKKIVLFLFKSQLGFSLVFCLDLGRAADLGHFFDEKNNKNSY